MGNSWSQAVEIRSLIADVTFPPSLCMQETLGKECKYAVFFWLLEPPFCWSKLALGPQFFWLAWGGGAKIMIWNPQKNMCFLSKVGMYRILPSILGGCPSILTVNLVTCPGKTGVTSDPLTNQELTPKKTAGISLETNAKYPWSYFRIEIRRNMGWIYAPYNNRGKGLIGIGDFLLESFFVSGF